MSDWEYYQCECGRNHAVGVVCAIGKWGASKPDAKWRNVPRDKHEADMAVIGKHCIVCGSTLLVPIIRPPIDVWKVHCNHCATEMPIAVLLNRRAWKI